MGNNYKEALECMVWQFGYRGVVDGKPTIWSGGLSALKEAFDALGWDNPHFIPEEGNTCEVVGCLEELSAQTHWDGMYVCICSRHYIDSYSQKPRPLMKEWAYEREATRGEDGRLP